MAPKQKKLIDKTELISTFAENIEKLLDTEHRNGTYITYNTYIEIDGLPVDILIKKEKKGRNIYTLKIKVTNDIIFLDDNPTDDELLLVNWPGFYSIKEILKTIEIIKKDYKLVDHRLIDPNQIEEMNVRRTFFPIPADKYCSVCNEPTIEYTVCKHPICFRCRYNCIATNIHTCPICNFGKLNRFPNELIYHDP